MTLFYPRKVTHMNKNKLIATGVIATLLVSNGSLGYTYYNNTQEYKKELSNYIKINYNLDNDKNGLSSMIVDLQSELETSITDVKKLTEELESKSNEVEKLENQIDKLEQELEKGLNDGESPSVSSTATEYIVTAYTDREESTGKSPGDPAYGITASGAETEEGVTLSCPPELEFGTKVNIENVGTRVCQDTGSAIQGNRLDLYIESLSKAIEFGKQVLKVEIID